MSLITLAIQDIPEVILVTDQPDLALVSRAAALLIEKNLHPSVVSPALFGATLARFSKEKKFIYKTIIITGFNQKIETLIKEYDFGSSSLDVNQTIVWESFFDELTSSQIPATYLLNQTTCWPKGSTHHFAKACLAKNNQAQRILDLAQDSPLSQIFVARDCLSQTLDQVKSGGEMELPLLLATTCAHERVLLDPQRIWHLQTQESFFEAIAQQLLKPHHPGRILIQGKPVFSQVILTEISGLIEKYFAYSPTLLPLVADADNLSFDPEIVCQVDSEIQTHLDFQIRTLPHSLMKLEEFSRKAQSCGHSAVFSPRFLMTGFASSELSTPKLVSSANLNSTKANHPPTSLEQSIKKPAQTPPLAEKTAESTIKHQRMVETELASGGLVKIMPVDQSKYPTSSIVEASDLEGELQRIFSQQRGGDLHIRLVDKARITQKIIGKKKRHKAVFYLGFGLAATGIITLCLWGIFQVSYLAASQSWARELRAYSKLNAGEDLTEFVKNPVASYWLKPLEWQLKLYKPLLDEELLADATTIIGLKDDLRSYISQEVGLKKNFGDMIKGLVNQPILDPEAKIKLVQTDLVNHQKTTTALEEKLTKINLDNFNSIPASQLKDLRKQSGDTLGLIKTTQAFLKIFPEVVGLDGKKVYALIVQDQQELRPTGGFIQSVGLLKFDAASLVDASFKSTDEYDNKLSAKVRPPDEIAKYLGESSWFLRDSNWSSDFPTTAQQVNYFLKEAANQPVDGVIGITYETVKKWLGVVGPIDIPELNEQISEKNFYDRLEFHTEAKSVEVAGKKLDYMSLIMTKMFAKLSQLSPEKLVTWTLMSNDLLASHDIQMAQFGQAGEFWNSQGWSGAIIDPNCPVKFATSQCYVDSLYQVDANVGINKVNAFIQKKVVDHVDVTKTQINHSRIVTYRNQSKLDNWPQGTYRAFVKFYLSQDATDSQIFINGAQVAPDQIVSYVEQGRSVRGTLVLVTRQQPTTLELKYHQPISPKSDFSYFFFNQKQAGVAESQEVILTYQPSLKVRQISPQAELASQLLSFSFVGKNHSFVAVTFE